MKLRLAFIAILIAASLSALSGHVNAQTSGGKLRFLHALPGGNPVDVFVDNVLTARNLPFSSATRYINVPTGEHSVLVQATAKGATPSGTALLTAKVTVTKEQVNQLIVVGGTAQKPEVNVYPQDLGPVPAGKTRVSALNAVRDAPPLDIRRADNNGFIEGLKYSEPYGEIDIAAVTLNLTVVPAGGDLTSALVAAQPLSMVSGTHNTLVAVGTLDGAIKPSLLLLTAPTEGNAATDILVRFANLSDAEKPLDVYVDDVLTVPGLTFKGTTEHIALPATASKIDIRQTGDAPVITAIAGGTLSAGTTKAFTIVVSGEKDKLAVTSFPNDVSTLTATQTRLNLINTVDKPGNLIIAGKPFISAVTNAAPGKATEIQRGVYKFELALEGDTNVAKGNLTVNGGTLADVIIGGAPGKLIVVLATTGINEQPGSVSPTTTPDEVVPVAVAAVGSPTATSAIPVAPPAATQPPAVAPDVTATPRPVVLPGATGVVITNDGVNLKIREYPRADAKTLGLVPSGSSVKILGVKGPNSKTATPGVQGTKAKTPTLVATARADVWLFIEWETDGGTISGWTIAQFLDITINGKLIRRDNIVDVLALKQIPDDQFGVIDSGAVTPVAPDDKRTIGTVTTLPGTNAQLRRTPSFKGESLSLVPSGGIVYVLGKTTVPVKGEVGEPKSPTWFNVQFDVEGSSVFGWMSADNLVLSIKYNGKPVDEKDVPVVSEIIPGSIRGNATQVQPSTKPSTVAIVVNMNAGANLQLRRDPNANAESLIRVPSGSEVDVVGRNGAGDWLQVRFGGITGWASANFLKVTKSGKLISIKELKIVNGEKDTFVPSATPTGTKVG